MAFSDPTRDLVNHGAANEATENATIHSSHIIVALSIRFNVCPFQHLSPLRSTFIKAVCIVKQRTSLRSEVLRDLAVIVEDAIEYADQLLPTVNRGDGELDIRRLHVVAPFRLVRFATVILSRMSSSPDVNRTVLPSAFNGSGK